MNEWEKLNYTSTWIDENTKSYIHDLFKADNKEEIQEYINWLEEHQSDFLLHKKDFIFGWLVACKHFDITDNLLNTFRFDEKISNSISFHLSMNFNLESFDYWASKVQKLDKHTRYDIYKKFWPEYLSFQFMRPEEFKDNIKNLGEVFKGIPFYTDNDMVNGYMIKNRKDFFDNKLDNRIPQYKDELLKSIAQILATSYLQPETIIYIKEEFEHNHQMIQYFETFKLHATLGNQLSTKSTDIKRKI